MTNIADSLCAAIITKYHGPTNRHGARISADAGMNRRVMIPLDYSLSTFEAHAKAAKALQDMYGWTSDLIAGGTETGFVFVSLP